MPTVIVQFKDTPQGEYHLVAGATLTIGRRPGNDIVIDNLAVSGSHAAIEGRDRGFLLTDLHSKNGTFVNGALTASHWLQPGDEITIGKHTLLFTGAEAQAVSQAADATMVLDTEEYRALLRRSPAGSAGSAPAGTLHGVLAYRRGGEGEVLLTTKLTRIGRDPAADIDVRGLLVGRTAATVSRRPAGWFLSSGGGLRRPRVNGVAVRQAVLLKDGDTIAIGGAQFVFLMRP
jgi:pSer/pThr/pTyr-binding forkhead associated (FHA) protein